MYNEDSYRHHLIWIQIKRVFFMILFSIIGCALGIFISSYLINVLLFDKIYRVITITCTTLLFFFFSLVSTANTGKEIQDGYWKIAVLRKLTLISKKLDTLDNLDKLEKLNNLELLDKLETISQKLSNNTITSNSSEIQNEVKNNNLNQDIQKKEELSNETNTIEDNQ